MSIVHNLILSKVARKLNSKDLKNHELIKTDDGSPSAYSKIYGENFHNTTGAVSETKTHYINGCKVVNRAKSQDLSILEVGFGLGIGVLETFKAVKDLPCRVSFTSLEIDTELPEYFSGLDQPFKMKKTSFGFEAQERNFKLRILVGNARTTLVKDTHKFNAIYQDAFSPKRNAILWTKEWFELLKSKSCPDCIMSTYSSSSSIRKAMLEAGWTIKKGVKFGPKRSSTRAYLEGQSDEDIIEHLKRSPAPVLTDAIANDYTLRDKK